jgi:release factor glutamine methyltransferase
MTIKKAINKYSQKLKNAGIESYVLDAQLLLAHVLKSPKMYVLINPDSPVNRHELEEYSRLITIRQKRYPIQYILGKCEFMSLEFKVTPATLIPRPDTEILVESVIAINPPHSILEIGTGSGCISVSLAVNLPNVQIDAIDICPESLKVAEQNAIKHNVQNRINFIRGDIMQMKVIPKYDVIVSNPPYIETGEIVQLQPEVRKHEPISALDGGADGLDFYRRIAEIAPPSLNEDGVIALELGHSQLEAVKSIFNMENEVYKDLAGIDRVIHFQAGAEEYE